MDAGIKPWMLTGDKLETAKCIATSTGFKKFSDNFFVVDKIENIEQHKYFLIEGKNL